MTDLNLIASAPQTHSADVLDPFKIIDDMVDLRIQMAQLEQQIRELQPLFFAACFRLNQAKIDRSRAITALLGLIAHPETPRFLARQRLSGFHCTP